MQPLPILVETNRVIREFAGAPPSSSESWQFLCECGCFETVDLTLDEFDAMAHVLKPGHTLLRDAATEAADR